MVWFGVTVHGGTPAVSSEKPVFVEDAGDGDQLAQNFRLFFSPRIPPEQGGGGSGELFFRTFKSGRRTDPRRATKKVPLWCSQNESSKVEDDAASGEAGAIRR